MPRGTCGRAVSPAEGTMLGTGVNNGADGKLPGPLPSRPRGSGPPARPCSGGRNPAGPVSGVTPAWPVGEAPASTSPTRKVLGDFGEGAHTSLPPAAPSHGGLCPGGGRRGLGMGTARGELYLSLALYLHRNLLRGWTLPLPFTGRDWPQQTLHPRAWRGAVASGTPSPESDIALLEITSPAPPKRRGPRQSLALVFTNYFLFLNKCPLRPQRGSRRARGRGLCMGWEWDGKRAINVFILR